MLRRPLTYLLFAFAAACVDSSPTGPAMHAVDKTANTIPLYKDWFNCYSYDGIKFSCSYSHTEYYDNGAHSPGLVESV